MNKKRRVFLCIVLFIIFILFTILSFVLYKCEKKQKLIKSELQLLDSANYSICTISNWDTNITQDFFTTYYGQEAFISSVNIDSPKVLSKYLQTSLHEDSTMHTFFIFLDPYQLKIDFNKFWNNPFKRKDMSTLLEEAFGQYTVLHPNINFYVSISTRFIDDYKKYSSNEMEKMKNAYQEFMAFADNHENIIVNSLMAEEWFITNSNLYGEKAILTKEATDFILANQIASAAYRLNTTNFGYYWEELVRVLNNIEKDGFFRSNMDNDDIVFLGDSMFDLDKTDGFTVSGMVHTLTNARVYNISKCGARISGKTYEYNFNNQIDRLIDKTYRATDDSERCLRETEKFVEDIHSDRKLTFVIMYGFNDYSYNNEIGNMTDNSPETFLGSLNKGITTLKTHFPDAKIELVSPIYTMMNNEGTTPFVENGNVLLDYVNAMKDNAVYNNISFINSFEESGIDAESAYQYLSLDKVHPTHRGFYQLAKMIIKHMNE